jgi:iron complex outermembrane recepter protein
MFKKTKVCAAVSLAFGGALALAAGSAVAQDQKLERVEITGSAIKRIDAETALPVTIIKVEELTRQGITNAEQAVARIAASQSTLGVSQGVGATTGGESNADLRGLGGNKTLVLLNGRRVANHAYEAAATDLNAIPLAAIDRIEVLRDGASAVYGTDAIGGVINFVLRREFTGAEISAEALVPFKKGGDTHRASVVGGVTGEGVRLMGVLDLRTQKVVEAPDRSFSASGVVPSQGQFRTSGTSFPGDLDGFEPSLPNCSPPSSIPNAAGTACRYDFVRDIDIVPKNQQVTMLGRMGFDLTKDISLDFEYLRAQNETRNKVAPTPTSMVLPDDSPYWITGRPVTDFGGGLTGGVVNWRVVPAGKRTDEAKSVATRMLAELKGTLGTIDFRAGLARSGSQVSSDFTNGYINADLIQQGLLDGVINPFGSQTPDGAEAIQAGKIQAQVLKARGGVTTADLRLSTDLTELPGGPMAISLGSEYRRERFDYDLQDIARQAASSGLELAADTSAFRQVAGVFGELSVPFAKGLEVSLAARYDKYGGTGTTFNPKLSLRWQPSKEFLLRGSVNTGYRAPTLYDIYEPQQLTFTSDTYNDPLLCPNDTAVPGASAGVVCDQQVQQRFGGPAAYGTPVSNLKPEKSKTLTFGAVIEPTANTSIGVDFWWIRLRDTIDQLPEQSIFEDPVKFNSRIVRCSQLTVAQRADIDVCLNFPAFDPIAYIDTPTENLGERKTNGVDLSLAFRSPATALGTFQVNIDGTYVTKYDYQREKGGEFQRNAGRYSDASPIFRWQHVAQFTWTAGPWSTTLAQRFKSGYDDQTAPNKVGSYSLFDLSFTYTGIKDLSLTAGLKNILDTDPPYTNQATTFQSNFDPRFTDPLGRSLNVRAAYKF